MKPELISGKQLEKSQQIVLLHSTKIQTHYLWYISSVKTEQTDKTDENNKTSGNSSTTVCVMYGTTDSLWAITGQRVSSIGLSSILRPTNTVQVIWETVFKGQKTQSMKETATKEKSDNANNKIHICIHNNRQKRIQIYSTTSPKSTLIWGDYWLGDGSHRGQVCQAWTAVRLPPQYPQHVSSMLKYL